MATFVLFTWRQALWNDHVEATDLRVVAWLLRRARTSALEGVQSKARASPATLLHNAPLQRVRVFQLNRGTPVHRRFEMGFVFSICKSVSVWKFAFSERPTRRRSSAGSGAWPSPSWPS